MTHEIYEHATALRNSKKLLERAEYIMQFSYPQIKFSYDGVDVEVNFAALDEETRAQLKNAISNVIKRRQREIEAEFNKL